METKGWTQSTSGASAQEQNAKTSKIFREAAEEYRAALKRDGISPKAAAQAKRSNPTPDSIAHEQRRRFLVEQATDVQRLAVAAIVALEVGDLRTMGECWKAILAAMATARPTYAAMRADEKFMREQAETATVQEGGNA